MCGDNRNPFSVMRSCLSFVLLLALATTVWAEDTHSWDSLGQLKTGDHVRLSLVKRPPLGGEFVNWTPELITVGSTTAKREEVVEIERYQPGGWSRGKRAVLARSLDLEVVLPSVQPLGGVAIALKSGRCPTRQVRTSRARGQRRA